MVVGGRGWGCEYESQTRSIAWKKCAVMGWKDREHKVITTAVFILFFFQMKSCIKKRNQNNVVFLQGFICSFTWTKMGFFPLFFFYLPEANSFNNRMEMGTRSPVVSFYHKKVRQWVKGQISEYFQFTWVLFLLVFALIFLWCFLFSTPGRNKGRKREIQSLED